MHVEGGVEGTLGGTRTSRWGGALPPSCCAHSSCAQGSFRAGRAGFACVGSAAMRDSKIGSLLMQGSASLPAHA